MYTLLKLFGAVLMIIVLAAGITACSFATSSMNLMHYSFFAPKYEEVRRNVFEQTQSYVDGKNQSLSKYKLEYDRADAEGKSAIKFTIAHEFATVDPEIINVMLRPFLYEMLK